ncbi:hypothetical protein JCM3765_002904 [Sporobolomyces pararoseus]
MTSTPTVAPIHLAPLHPDDFSQSRTPSGLSHKDSFLSTFPGEPIEPNYSRKRKRFALPRVTWNWHTAETVLWATVPLVFYAVPIALLLAVLLSNGPEMAFMVVKEKVGTGRLEYYVLNSCAISPGTAERVCTRRSLYVDFVPSILKISSSLPGFSSLKLPFHSYQTPSILLTSLSILIFSFLLYLPLWTLVYFPNAPFPPQLVRWIRYRSRPLFYLVGIFSFLAFIFTLSIGIGYKCWFLAFLLDFKAFVQFGAYQAGAKDSNWVTEIGSGFDAIWAATVCEALTVIAINISLHNGLDERVEWPKDQKENVNTFGAF